MSLRLLSLERLGNVLHKISRKVDTLASSTRKLATIHPSADFDPRSVRLSHTARLEFQMQATKLKSGTQVSVGEGSVITGSITLERMGARVTIGKRVFMSGHIVAAADVSIGDDVLIAWGTTIVDTNAHSVKFSDRASDLEQWRQRQKDWSNVRNMPIVIRDKAWLGFNSIILRGVTLGEGAIIGAGSVVTRDVPPWTIVAGNPAKAVRSLSADER